MIVFLRNKEKSEELNTFGPVSDLMAGLMIVFMFLSVAYISSNDSEMDLAAQIAHAHKQIEIQKQSIQSLKKENKDLQKIIEKSDNFKKIEKLTVKLSKTEQMLSSLQLSNTELQASNAKLEQSYAKIGAISNEYFKTKEELLEELRSTFQSKFDEWGAKIDDKNLSIRFEKPEALFLTGKSDLSEKFKNILKEFFPAYIKILKKPKYRKALEAVRIEGHTSSEWEGPGNPYFQNMSLSQERTKTVLEYCYNLFNGDDDIKFIKEFISANGLSSSKLKYLPSGEEDKEKSRRVEFRSVIDANAKLMKINDDMSR